MVRSRPIWFHLIGLVFASLIPVLLFGIIVAVLFEGQPRASLERSLRDTAWALTVLVDHELISSLSTLQALVISEHLDTGDLRLFYESAQRALRAHQSNAIKFSSKRAVISIEVGFQRTGDQHVYFTKDNGVGFDMRYAHKLFGVFQRLHRAEEYEGTGVGLAMVQRIIHRHCKRIWAEAAVDQRDIVLSTGRRHVPCLRTSQMPNQPSRL